MPSPSKPGESSLQPKLKKLVLFFPCASGGREVLYNLAFKLGDLIVNVPSPCMSTSTSPKKIQNGEI